jgi:hypothetical protein
MCRSKCVRKLFELRSDCRSGLATFPPEPLQEQPAVVLLWGRPLSSWLLALGERGGTMIYVVQAA